MTIFRMAKANATRHFIVWGTLAVILMFAGIHENQNGTEHFERQSAPGTLEHVFENHKCKTDVDNAGALPKAVIVREIGGGFIYSESDTMIGKALDEEFGDKNWPRFEAQNFCM